jgi:hypothetical protein
MNGYFYKPNKEGSQRLSAGIYVTIISVMTIAINSGSNGLITLSIPILATLQPTKSTEPTGGVHNPMQRLSTITMPK